MSTETPSKNSLDDWLEIIRDQKMPIFDQTVHRIIELAEDDLAPMSALASVILQDASMTARALKLANSILYNPTSTGISTITRAVVVLGFNAVRNMCLTLSLIDALVKGPAKERLERELARAMHAATQARALAVERGDKSPEEVFIATLLYRVGELAFWCFGNEYCERIEDLAKRPGMSPEAAQERVLGFRLSHLSRRLIHEWQLTELLQEAIEHPARMDPRIQTIMLGQQIARCAEEHGWNAPPMERLIQKAAHLIACPEPETETLLHREARAASELARDCGAPAAATLIPQPSRSEKAQADAETSEQDAECAAPPPPAPHPDADPQLQVKILRELAAILVTGQGDFNIIMELVLEGIYRGVGMDRVVFALTTPDKQVIKAKYSLGIDNGELSRHFVFKRSARQPDLLFQTMDLKLPRLVTRGDYEETPEHIPEALSHLMGAIPFMVAPIVVNHRSIGLFYADRGLRNKALDLESYENFKHFVHQASLGLTQVSARPRPGATP